MKRWLAALLSCLFLFSLISPAVQAADERILIRSVDDLIELSQNCVADTWSVGKQVVLTCDLDVSGVGFSPIPLFAGTFDGQGYTIKGMTLTSPGSTQGLFRQILQGGTVRALHLEGNIVPSSTDQTIGGVAGINLGTIEDCHFIGTVSGQRMVGGVVGLNEPSGRIIGCSTQGSVSGQHQTGGIAGENAGLLERCTSKSKVNTTYQIVQRADAVQAVQQSGKLSPLTIHPSDLALAGEEVVAISDIGGIAGTSSGILRDCVNEGDIGYPHIGYNIGGIVGRQSGFVTGCSNLGTVTGRKDVGGIVGQIMTSTDWSEDTSSIDALQSQLDDLRDQVNQNLADATARQTQTRTQLEELLNRLRDTSDATSNLADQFTAWGNDNLEVINALSDRLSYAMDALPAIFDELTLFSDTLSDALEQGAQVSDQLGDALTDTELNTGSLYDTLDALHEALRTSKTAMGELKDAVAALNKAAGNGAQTDIALQNLAAGFSALSTALDNLSSNLNVLNTAFPAPDHTDVVSFIQQIPVLWQALGNYLKQLSQGVAQISKAISQISSAVSSVLAQTDIRALERALFYLEQAVGTMQSMDNDLTVLIASLRSALADLEQTTDDFSAAFEKPLRTLSHTLDTLHIAVNHCTLALSDTQSLLDDLSSLPSLSLVPIGAAQEQARAALRDSLDALHRATKALTDQATDTVVFDRLGQLSDQIDAIYRQIRTISDEASVRPDLGVTDVSAQSDTARTDGTVLSSVNRGAVTADTNVGGIVGTISLEIDLENEQSPSLSSLLIGGSQYTVYACVRACENYANITASKNMAGGIAGQTDYGALLDCLSGGSITASGQYAGGIVGQSKSTVQRCYARANLAGERYIGGIAGQGNTITDCRALVQLTGGSEFQGSIAGQAEGTIARNYYAQSTVGGIDGFSFAGQSDALSYDALIAMDNTPSLFRTITLTFVKDDAVYAERTLDFGGTLVSLPSVPDQDGQYWQWDDFDHENILYSMTIEGAYHRPITTLATGEQKPRFLAQGSFFDGQTVLASPFDTQDISLPFPAESLLAAYTVSVTDYHLPITVRMLTEQDGQLYLLDEDGQLVQTDFTRDGSYIVFPMQNSATLLYASDRHMSKLWAMVAVLILLVLVWLIWFIRKHKPHPSKPVPSGAESSAPHPSCHPMTQPHCSPQTLSDHSVPKNEQPAP